MGTNRKPAPAERGSAPVEGGERHVAQARDDEFANRPFAPIEAYYPKFGEEDRAKSIVEYYCYQIAKQLELPRRCVRIDLLVP